MLMLIDVTHFIASAVSKRCSVMMVSIG